MYYLAQGVSSSINVASLGVLGTEKYGSNTLSSLWSASAPQPLLYDWNPSMGATPDPSRPYSSASLSISGSTISYNGGTINAPNNSFYLVVVYPDVLWFQGATSWATTPQFALNGSGNLECLGGSMAVLPLGFLAKPVIAGVGPNLANVAGTQTIEVSLATPVLNTPTLVFSVSATPSNAVSIGSATTLLSADGKSVTGWSLSVTTTSGFSGTVTLNGNIGTTSCSYFAAGNAGVVTAPFSWLGPAAPLGSFSVSIQSKTPDVTLNGLSTTGLPSFPGNSVAVAEISRTTSGGSNGWLSSKGYMLVQGTVTTYGGTLSSYYFNILDQNQTVITTSNSTMGVTVTGPVAVANSGQQYTLTWKLSLADFGLYYSGVNFSFNLHATDSNNLSALSTTYAYPVLDSNCYKNCDSAMYTTAITNGFVVPTTWPNNSSNLAALVASGITMHYTEYSSGQTKYTQTAFKVNPNPHPRMQGGVDFWTTCSLYQSGVLYNSTTTRQNNPGQGDDGSFVIIVDPTDFGPGDYPMYFTFTTSDGEVSTSSNFNLHVTVSTVINCCFPAGSLVTMADGLTTKAIEALLPGDQVLTYNLASGTQEPGVVGNLLTPVRPTLYHVVMEDGSEVTPTPDHPLFTSEGWKAVDPIAASAVYPGSISELMVGDLLLSVDGSYKKVSSITAEQGSFQTYTLTGVEPNQNFYCSGVLAHNIAYCPYI